MEMKSLWKETFRDSSAYISLLFDNYFNDELVAVHREGENLVAALMGIPYLFKDHSGKGENLKGLYLCGLSTKKEMRRRGIMSGLIEEINRRAEAAGFDFTFLIPSDDIIRTFYKARGYYDAFFKKNEIFVKGHKFSKPEEYDVREYNKKDLKDVVDYLVSCFHKSDSPIIDYRLYHTAKDWEIVLQEALLSGERILLAEKEGSVKGIAIIRINKFEDLPGKSCRTSEVTVREMKINEKCDEDALLHHISLIFPDSNIKIIRNLTEVKNFHRLWSPFFAKNNNQGNEYEDMGEVEVPFNEVLNSYPAGMIRIFDILSLMKKCGCGLESSLKGFGGGELMHLLLRPSTSERDQLGRILDLPELSFTISSMLD